MRRLLLGLVLTLVVACGGADMAEAPPLPAVAPQADPPQEERREEPSVGLASPKTLDTGSAPAPVASPKDPPAAPARPSLRPVGVSTSPAKGTGPSSGGRPSKASMPAFGQAKPQVIAEPPAVAPVAEVSPEPVVAPEPVAPPETQDLIAGTSGSEGLSGSQGNVGAVGAQGIDAWLAGLPTEALVFNVPEEILFDEETEVKLLIQPGATGDALEATFEATRTDAQAGSVETAAARMSEEMGATLVSTKLHVTALTPERQFISRIEPTEWRWVVRGSEEGHHGLTLSLYAVLPQHSSVRVLKTFERQMNVKILARDAAVGFAKDNWEWLWTFLVAPIGAWVWARWKGKKDEEAEE